MGEEKAYNWLFDLDERTKNEVEFARIYAASFHHGTSGHLGYMTIAKLADLLDRAEDADEAAALDWKERSNIG